MTKVAGKSVLCVKSELHLNQDGVETGDGLATLPVKGLLHQIIAEAEPEIVITTGTSGAVTAEQALGSVVVTRGARFRLDGELRNEPFNGVQYNSDWEVPTSRMGDAIQIMRRFSDRIVEPPFAPPSKRFDDYQGGLVHGRTNEPKIWLDERDMPKNHPILSVDSFEFGTSANNLFDEGCACEMGDAVLGLVCDELGDDAPDWLVVRNLSIPQINADLPDKPRGLDMQTHWSVWYHETFGYWTSVNGALTCWAVIAGMES